MPLDIDQIAATTLKAYRRKLTDNVFDTHPLLYWLKDKQRVRFLDGGEKIVEQVMHTEGDTPAANGGAITDGSYGEWDDIAITPVETASAALYDWKSVAATIAISGLQEIKNNGEAQLVNLLEAKIMQAEETLKNNLSTMLWAASPTSATALTPLGVIIGDHTDSVTTVGGIDCAAVDNSGDFWRSHVVDYTATLAANLDLRKVVRKAHNTASKNGPDKIDIVMSGQGAWEQYEEDLLPTVRRTQKGLADAGFANLEVNGVPWTWDAGAPADVIYGISSKYLKLVGAKQRWFKQSKFTEGLATAQASNGGGASVVDARYSVITSYMELTTNNRRRHFKLTGLNLRP